LNVLGLKPLDFHGTALLKGLCLAKPLAAAVPDHFENEGVLATGAPPRVGLGEGTHLGEQQLALAAALDHTGAGFVASGSFEFDKEKCPKCGFKSTALGCGCTLGRFDKCLALPHRVHFRFNSATNVFNFVIAPKWCSSTVPLGSSQAHTRLDSKNLDRIRIADQFNTCFVNPADMLQTFISLVGFGVCRWKKMYQELSGPLYWTGDHTMVVPAPVTMTWLYRLLTIPPPVFSTTDFNAMVRADSVPDPSSRFQYTTMVPAFRQSGGMEKIKELIYTSVIPNTLFLTSAWGKTSTATSFNDALWSRVSVQLPLPRAEQKADGSLNIVPNSIPLTGTLTVAKNLSPNTSVAVKGSASYVATSAGVRFAFEDATQRISASLDSAKGLGARLDRSGLFLAAGYGPSVARTASMPNSGGQELNSNGPWRLKFGFGAGVDF